MCQRGQVWRACGFGAWRRGVRVITLCVVAKEFELLKEISIRWVIKRQVDSAKRRTRGIDLRPGWQRRAQSVSAVAQRHADPAQQARGGRCLSV